MDRDKLKELKLRLIGVKHTLDQFEHEEYSELDRYFNNLTTMINLTLTLINKKNEDSE